MATAKHSLSQLRLFLWGLSLILLAGMVAAALWNTLRPRPSRSVRPERALGALGNFGTVPAFSLVERSGRSVRRSDLRGKIWIANFIYTTCKDTCPLQSAEMAKLQEAFLPETEVRLVSVTVDPDQDTPDVLSRYADRFHADPRRWFFLTGERRAIAHLVQEGFRLSAVPVSTKEEKSPVIIHSSRFVLVDGEAKIRGYYDSSDPDALRRLRYDVQTLLDRG